MNCIVITFVITSLTLTWYLTVLNYLCHHSKALRSVGNPRKILEMIHQTIGELIVQLEEMLGTVHSEEERNESGEGIVTTNNEEETLSGIKV